MTRGKQQPTLEQRVLHFIQENRLVSSRQRLLVAVSGGPDSVCLLYVLLRLQDELNIRLHLAHLDHQIRGAESEADAYYVSNLAQQLGIPAIIERRDVRSYQARKHLSLEEAAREVRYTFLAQAAKMVGANRVAVGHTVDDHIETILMHLIRGAGTRGLRGLQPSTDWQLSGNNITIVRPLLAVKREETARYCRSHKLVPIIDASNLSLSTLRNRIRLELLPLLRGYNPQIDNALLRAARIAGDELVLLDEATVKLWGKIVQKEKNTIVLDKKGFLELPGALQRHLLRTAMEKLRGNIKDIETRHIEEIMTALSKPAGKSVSLPGGLVFSVEYDKYLLGLDAGALSPYPKVTTECPLNIPGETLLAGWHIKATFINREQMTDNDKDFTAYFDLDKSGDKLIIRPRQLGDRFQPLGMSQLKKLGEFMIDAKIPRAWRRQIPIVCSPEYILWVVGWRINDRVKVDENTRRVLCLKLEEC